MIVFFKETKSKIYRWGFGCLFKNKSLFDRSTWLVSGAFVRSRWHSDRTLSIDRPLFWVLKVVHMAVIWVVHQGSPWTGASVLSSTATVLLTILNLWLIICNYLLIYQAHQRWFFVPWVNANQSQASCRWELCRTMAAKPRKLFETVAVLNCVTRAECTMYKSGLHRFSAGEKINTCPLPIK